MLNYTSLKKGGNVTWNLILTEEMHHFRGRGRNGYKVELSALAGSGTCNPFLTSRSGGTGIRVRLKIASRSRVEGSTPSSGIKN